MITFTDFEKLDIRVAKIITAERVKKSRKLLRLEIRFGSEWRQLIAGIGENYSPEELINKEVIVVTNIAPKVIMGIESQGMLLAAESADGPVLLIPDKEVPPGTVVK